jgi:hypothetical protein
MVNDRSSILCRKVLGSLAVNSAVIVGPIAERLCDLVASASDKALEQHADRDAKYNEMLKERMGAEDNLRDGIDCLQKELSQGYYWRRRRRRCDARACAKHRSGGSRILLSFDIKEAFWRRWRSGCKARAFTMAGPDGKSNGDRQRRFDIPPRKSSGDGETCPFLRRFWRSRSQPRSSRE